MDQMQTSYQTVIPARTEEFMDNQITALRESIERKDALILSLQDRASENSRREYSAKAETQTMRDAMHKWTIDEFRNGDITEEQAEAIANIMGFELTQEVEAEVSVTYNITVQVPIGEDAEDIINDIDFETVSYNSDNISWLAASVDRIDI